MNKSKSHLRMQTIDWTVRRMLRSRIHSVVKKLQCQDMRQLYMTWSWELRQPTGMTWSRRAATGLAGSFPNNIWCYLTKKFTIEISNASPAQLSTIALELKIMSNGWAKHGPQISINNQKLQAPSLRIPGSGRKHGPRNGKLQATSLTRPEL